MPQPTSVSDSALIATCSEALTAARTLLDAAQRAVRAAVTRDGRVDSALVDAEQTAAHGLAWLATYVAALERMLEWARRLDSSDGFGDREALILRAAFGEYLAQIGGGIAMSQTETVRPHDLGLDETTTAAFLTPAVSALIASGNTADSRARLAESLDGSSPDGFGDPALDDDTLAMIRDQFRRFGDTVVLPGGPVWHREDSLIPADVIAQMGALGVFGLTAPEVHGGAGLGKVAMCLVTEELSRAFLGVGSLATRSEIAIELLLRHGTEDQKARWLEGLIDGSIIPGAVFTEPDYGSDLASLKTRAVRDGDVYRLNGAKTWSTHAARADLLTVLARTDPSERGYKGLSMFFVEKPRGTESDAFPIEGLKGGEIKVLGYRGMKEYELAFDDFPVPATALLGGEEGQGFKQLMATFETARIQTAARAVGVARNALELGLAYGRDRQQFGRPIAAFPRVGGKLAWMAVETMIARQLTWHAAREKDAGRRCDLEAGMAKLLAARVAWANADCAVQIHGGNGYAEEYPVSRVLVDSRILSIFEGAAEIQAHIIARRLLAESG